MKCSNRLFRWQPPGVPLLYGFIIKIDHEQQTAQNQPFEDCLAPYPQAFLRFLEPEIEPKRMDNSFFTWHTSNNGYKIISVTSKKYWEKYFSVYKFLYNQLNHNVMSTTIVSPSPSCPVARNTLAKPGTGPITGFPSGTEIVQVMSFINFPGHDHFFF